MRYKKTQAVNELRNKNKDQKKYFTKETATLKTLFKDDSLLESKF